MTSWNIDFYAIDQSQETCTDFDTVYEYTSCIWPSIVYHSRLTICDCLRFTKVCFCPYTSEKQFCLNDINSSVMPCLDENQRLRAIGMLQAGLAQNVVARHFGCHRNTILSLWRRFRQSGNTRNHRRSGRPRVTSRCQDNHIRLVHLRNRFQTSNLTARSIPGLRPISSRTVHNRLREHNIRPRRPAIRPILLPRHHAARLTWCRRYLRFRIQDWANILFTDESWFHLDSTDGRSRVYRRVGERYADACVIQRQSFGSGSVTVWGGITAHGRTPLVVVAGNLTGIRYLDEIVQPYVIPFIQAQANNVTFQQDNARPHVARVVRDYLTQ